MTPSQKGLLCGVLWAVAVPVGAIVSRDVATVGEIVRVKGNEEVRFVELPAWRAAEVQQTLAPGDTVRTGPYGGLAILFQDETQIRVHRNTLLIIKDIRRPDTAGSSTTLELVLGSVWTRAQRLLRAVTQRETVTMQTPSATIGIRGTDWFASVDEQGKSTLVVLSGSARLFNPFGEVTVERGEVATAEVGKPPNKRVLVDLRDRPLIVLELTLEWFDILSITGESSQTLKQLRTSPQPGNAREALEQAEYAYDLHQYSAARELLRAFERDLKAIDDPTGELTARADIVRGLLLVRAHEYDAADALFRDASRHLAGRARMVAQLGLVATLIQRKRYVEAEEALERLAPVSTPSVEVPLFRATLLSFAGEHVKAVDAARDAKEKFPRDARPPALLAHFYLLTDDTVAMKASIDEALALDPDNQFAWHWRGMYYYHVEPDADRALESYRRSLEINPEYVASWNNLGLVHLALGDYEASRAALKKAMAVDPHVALPVTNYAGLLSILDRFEESEQELERAFRIEAGQPESYLGKGTLFIQQGKPAEGAEEILKAIAANPDLPTAHISLAEAYYQAGRFAEARQAINQARDFDPRDPVAPLIGSAMAQDQARAGEAIELAQDSLDKARKYGFFAVESVTSTRSGLTNLGSAFTNLGLNDWGAYYANLSFNPYDPNGYFFLSLPTGYPSASARWSSSGQGLLLDPTAVSAPTRYIEFWREPRHDLSLGGTIGNLGGAAVYGASGTYQGFLRASNPTAYRVSFWENRNDGFRENSLSNDWSFSASVGTRFNDRKQNLLFDVYGSRSKRGLPGPSGNPDPDDTAEFDQLGVSVGYHHRFAFDNRILARVSAGNWNWTLDNPAPFGTGFSDRDLSLLNAFGLNVVNALYAVGLYDATALLGGNSNNPAYAFAAFGAALEFFFGIPRLSSTIPASFDLNQIRQRQEETNYYSLQFRQLLTKEPVDFTYGLEWFPSDTTTTLVFDEFTTRGTGALADFGFLQFFPFGGNVRYKLSADRATNSGQAYVQALWRMTPEVSTEAGLYLRYLDLEGIGDRTELDPRLGLGWQITPDQWLRFAWQREFRIPQPPSGTLAPVSVVGLVVPDIAATALVNAQNILFFQRGGTPSPSALGAAVPDVTATALLGFGGVTKSLQARWDAQWSRNLYTYIAADQEDFDSGLTFTNPDWFFDTAFVDQGWVRRLGAGANLWLGGNVGLFANVQGAWSENQSAGPGYGRELPLIPDITALGGVTWVQPNQLRLNLWTTYTGSRWGDVSNTVKLDGYWTVNANALWQPLQKHVALNLSVLNLFDKDFEVAPGFPAPGRSIFLTGEYRF